MYTYTVLGIEKVFDNRGARYGGFTKSYASGEASQIFHKVVFALFNENYSVLKYVDHYFAKILVFIRLKYPESLEAYKPCISIDIYIESDY